MQWIFYRLLNFAVYILYNNKIYRPVSEEIVWFPV